VGTPSPCLLDERLLPDEGVRPPPLYTALTDSRTSVGVTGSSSGDILLFIEPDYSVQRRPPHGLTPYSAQAPARGSRLGPVCVWSLGRRPSAWCIRHAREAEPASR
jgi:hypothetical protein